MKKLLNWIKDDESGQGMVEYALIIALVAVVLIGAIELMTGGISSTFSAITAKL